MTIKHIFSDMDGTILNSTGAIDRENEQLIKSSQIPLTLVSARAPMEMDFAIKQLNLQNAQIAFNGGLIFQNIQGDRKIIQKTPIDLTVVKKIVQQIKEKFPNISLSFYDIERWYTEKVDEGIKFETSITHKHPVVGRFVDVLNQSSEIFKIMLVTFEPTELTRLKQFLADSSFNQLSIQQAGSSYIEITNETAKKSKGIKYVVESENLSLDETAAFGDGHNDIPMLEMVGHPIVMENALPEIKKYAKDITATNNDNGVGKGIHQFLMGSNNE